MQSKDAIIQRGAGDKTKGFRLQKLRAIHLALDRMASNPHANIYCATEMHGDVLLYCGDSLTSSELLEEDKDYDAATAFTLNNDRVRNSLVLFIEVWNAKAYSENLYFSFYTTATIGKEQPRGALSGCVIPPDGLLRSMAANPTMEDSVLAAVKTILCEEYRRQHKSDGSCWIDDLSDDLWISFFARITWTFEQKNEVELEKAVLQQIRDSADFDPNMHSGYEQLILSKLLDDLDKKQSLSDHFERILTASEIRYVFLYVERGKYRPDDPTWASYGEIETSDKRNLREKFLAACPHYPNGKLGSHVRKALSSKAEQNYFKGDNSLKAMMYRIYDQCVDYIEGMPKGPYTTQQLDEHLTTLKQKAVAVIEQCSRDYRYPIQNDASIYNMLLDLFESCYLSFENEGEVSDS